MTLQQAAAHQGEVDAARPPWHVVADGRRPAPRQSAPTSFGAFSAFWLASSIALLGILLIGTLVSRRAADFEALRDAGAATELLATSVLEPVLEDGLLTGDPGAIARLDAIVVGRILTADRVRVKLWTVDGTIVYSDESRLIGQTFALDDEERDAVVNGGAPIAEVSDLGAPENAYERSHGKLLEVYRMVLLPNGTHLLFETYSPYSQITERRSEVWRSFAPSLFGAVLVLQFCQLPLVWSLARWLRSADREREELSRQAIEASTNERRRIAGNVHDSVVQGLAGASFSIAGAVDAVERGGMPTEAAELRNAAAGVRESIRGLRSMLVEIYPPSIASAGLASALHDLIAPLRGQGVNATARTPDVVDLPREVEALVFRVAQEALRNVAQHSAAGTASVSLTVDAGVVVLEVADDGVGLDVDAALTRRDGHVGMQVLRDVAEQAGAVLKIASAPGAGTRIRLEVPSA